MKQTCRRTPMPKSDFNEVVLLCCIEIRFGMSVLLYIWCIFSEHLFLLGGCFWCFCEIYQVLQNIVFKRTPPVAASKRCKKKTQILWWIFLKLFFSTGFFIHQNYYLQNIHCLALMRHSQSHLNPIINLTYL